MNSARKKGRAAPALKAGVVASAPASKAKCKYFICYACNGPDGSLMINNISINTTGPITDSATIRQVEEYIAKQQGVASTTVMNFRLYDPAADPIESAQIEGKPNGVA